MSLASVGSNICRLCLQKRELVQSHVIPDFQIRLLKKAEGHFFELSPSPEKGESKRQRGPVERLLCAECDNERLQKNESYFAMLWSRRHLPNTAQYDSFLIFRDHDYKRTKNFLLSALWRISISSREFFRDVSLGARHEEILRAGLLGDREFAENEYPVLITVPLFDGRFHADFILQPDTIRLDGNRAVRCVIGGLLYTFVVGSQPVSPVVTALSLRRAEMPVLRKEIREIPFLADAVHQLGRANRERELRRR